MTPRTNPCPPDPSTTSRPASEAALDARLDELATSLAGEQDPAARAELVESIVVLAMPLADGLALRYRGRGIETEDLLQVARTALVKAANRYRPGAGKGFTAFARPTISGELKRWFRDQGWAVRPPRRLQELRADLAVAEEQARHALCREPRDSELAHLLGVTVAEVGEARCCSAGYHAVSLDTPSTLTGVSVADQVLVAADGSTSVDLHDALCRALASLTERERLVVELRFVEELTQREIGERIGVSQMQVSRVLGGVLDRLRAVVLPEAGPLAPPAAKAA
jgi:RNA polymerase sigma-B factor